MLHGSCERNHKAGEKAGFADMETRQILRCEVLRFAQDDSGVGDSDIGAKGFGNIDGGFIVAAGGVAIENRCALAGTACKGGGDNGPLCKALRRRHFKYFLSRQRTPFSEHGFNHL